MNGTLDAAILEGALERVCAHTGFALTAEMRLNATAGVTRAWGASGLSGAEFLARLGSSPEALDALVDEVVITESYFFRDPAHFAWIRRAWIADVRARRGPDARLRVWSAGCGGGEEAYSLAITLADAGVLERTELVATDVSRAALARARAATYSRWSLREADGTFLSRWFRQDGSAARDTFILDPELARRVTFHPLNLQGDEAFPGDMDLIVCRNVAIYFTEVSLKRLAERLHASLADGGWLLLGPSDPPLQDSAPFAVHHVGDQVLLRKGAPSPTPVRPEPSVRTVRALPRDAPGTPAARSPEVTLGEARVLADAHRLAEAELLLREALAQWPNDKPLRALHTLVLVDAGRHAEAAQAARGLLFLDNRLALGHLLLGVSLQALGDTRGARRAYDNAQRLCAAQPADGSAELADGKTFGQLRRAADAQLRVLGAEEAPGGRRHG